MNKPLHPVAAPAEESPVYDDDGYGWSVAQAALIRAKRFDAIDWDNVAEEIESVGRGEQSGAESALRVLMAHILKWQHQPERRGRSWALSIAEQRLRYDDRMSENPSLQPRRDEMRRKAFRRARIEAAREMDVDLKTLPTTPPSWETILDEPFEFEA